MHTRKWQFQDAQAEFSQVVDAALRGEPQHITRRGKDAVVVLSEQTFEALQRSANAEAPGLIAHLLARPKVKAKTDISFERREIKLRDVNLK